jgi:hypothetical protein
MEAAKEWLKSQQIQVDDLEEHCIIQVQRTTVVVRNLQIRYDYAKYSDGDEYGIASIYSLNEVKERLGFVQKSLGRSKFIEYYYRYEKGVYQELVGQKQVFPQNQRRFLVLDAFYENPHPLDPTKKPYDISTANKRRNTGDEAEERKLNEYYAELLEACHDKSI